MFPDELLTGAFFIFLNRHGDLMKVLYWDGDGFVIFFKRLERGTFSTKSNSSSLMRREFLMLLEGVEPKKFQQRFSL
jgi:transposase